MRAAKTQVQSIRLRRQFSFPREACVLTSLAILFASHVLGQAPSVVAINKSVVKISVRRGAGKVSVGTGFVWSKDNYVVTALHVVAGAQDKDITVYVQLPNLSDESKFIEKSSGAKVIKVHYGADLALLELTEPLGLAPLALGNADLDQDHDIWGFPKAIPEMKSDRVRFSKGVMTKPTFQSYFPTPEEFKQQVGEDGYPKYETQILRVSDIIQPGHSGAPIIDKTGKVVGIGDGGLYEGIRRINWAIPATLYVPKLMSSTETPPPKPSVREARFSFQVEKSKTQEVIAFDSGKEETTAHQPTVSGKKQPVITKENVEAESEEEIALHLSWSASLAEILETADEEDAKSFQEINAEARKATGYDLNQAVINVYEDYETGATLAMPEGFSIHYDKATRMLQAWSESQQVEMIIQILPNETWEAGVQAKDAFSAYIEGLDGDAQWQGDPEIPDEEPYYDKNEAYWSWEKSRIVTDDDGETHSKMYATLVIDDNNFLGMSVFARDLQALSPEDLKLFYLMMACVELADFAIE